MNSYYIDMMIEGITLTKADFIWLIPVFIYILIATIIDSKTMKIPNKLNYAMLILRFAFAYLVPIEGKHILGGLLGGALILIPAMVILKPMGGDIKFLTVLGLWIGDIPVLISLIIAVILFIVYAGLIKKMDKKQSLAFAPFVGLSYTILTGIGFLIGL